MPTRVDKQAGMQEAVHHALGKFGARCELVIHVKRVLVPGKAGEGCHILGSNRACDTIAIANHASQISDLLRHYYLFWGV